MSSKRFYAPWPTVPANNETIVLFTTHSRAPGGSGAPVQPSVPEVMPQRISTVTITFLRHNKASAANGLRVYARDDTGTWRETDLPNDSGNPTVGAAAAIQVAALTPPATQRETFVVSSLNGVAIEYTAGADNPENWNGIIAIEADAMAVLL